MVGHETVRFGMVRYGQGDKFGRTTVYNIFIEVSKYTYELDTELKKIVIFMYVLFKWVKIIKFVYPEKS